MAGNFNPKDYIDVQQRITRFWSEYPDGAIRTDLASNPDDFKTCRYRAEVYKHRDHAHPDAVGYAFEIAGSGMANKTSHEENCETSAIGRALANLGYATSNKDRPSRQEMQKVAAGAPQMPQDAPKPANATPDISSAHTPGMRRIHAVGNKHGFTHEDLRILCDREERAANNRRIASMNDAPEALLMYVSDLIEKDAATQRAWLDQLAELNPGPDVIPNPN